jgi:hypothetical protein
MSEKHDGPAPSRSRDAWIEKARRVPIESIAPQGLKRHGKELVGPCHRGWLSGRAADLILDLHLGGRPSDLPILHDRSVRP